MKKIWKAASAAMLLSCLSACSDTPSSSFSDAGDDRPVIVCTNFAEYDFVRSIGGDLINNVMLIKPGSETHSFEPTPQDIIKMSSADLLVYVGGDSDSWVVNILDSLEDVDTFRLMDHTELYEEEIIEGMEEHEHEEEEHEHEEGELDEHVWNSLPNAVQILKDLEKEIEEIDPANAETYRANAAACIAEIEQLDQEFRTMISTAARQEIVVGDRFPFMYFTKEYGLTYYAAFPGCTTDTEPSAQTVAFLIDKVKEDSIPVVFHIELSNEKMCDSICEATGAKKELLHAIHNVTVDDFTAGVTYVDLMKHNYEVLKEALN